MVTLVCLKLSIVAASLFVTSHPDYPELPFAAQGTVLFLYMLWMVSAWPYVDKWENIMEVSATGTNLVNVAVPVALGREWLDEGIAGYLLTGVNGFNIVLMVVLVAWSLVRWCKLVRHIRPLTHAVCRRVMCREPRHCRHVPRGGGNRDPWPTGRGVVHCLPCRLTPVCMAMLVWMPAPRQETPTTCCQAPP